MAKNTITFRIENSAPSQKRPAEAVGWSTPILRAEGVENIVDVGCGRFRNLPILVKNFPKITLVDTPYQCERIRPLLKFDGRAIVLIDNIQFERMKKEFDGIFCISVIHTIPEVNDRKKIIRDIFEKLKVGGLFVLDVPVHETYYRRKCTAKNKHKDGWFMGKAPYYAFYRDFSAKEIDEFVLENGNFEILKRNNQIKHITRIFKKRSARNHSV